MAPEAHRMKGSVPPGRYMPLRPPQKRVPWGGSSPVKRQPVDSTSFIHSLTQQHFTEFLDPTLCLGRSL